MMCDLPPAARCGQTDIPGMCWRPGDPNKHLGPPPALAIHYWSKLFSTRCGLTAAAGDWHPGDMSSGPGMGDDYWCPECLAQAGITYELYEEDEDMEYSTIEDYDDEERWHWWLQFGDGEPHEVTRAEWIVAERGAGFHRKGGGEGPATQSWGGASGMRGYRTLRNEERP